MREKVLSPFLTLCLVSFLVWTSYSMARNPLLPLFATDLGSNPLELGLVIAASTITGIFLKGPLGILSDIKGQNNLFVFGVGIVATVPFLYLFVDSFWELTAVRFLHGIATAILGPVTAAIIVGMFEKQRAAKVGWYTSATTLGKLLGPLVGGYVLLFSDYKTSYIIVGIFGLIAFLITFLNYNVASTCRSCTSPKKNSMTLSFKEVHNGFIAVLSNYPIAIIGAINAITFFTIGSLETLLPLYAANILEFHAGEIGIILTSQSVLVLFARPYIGMISDQKGHKPMIVSGLLIAGITLMLVVLTENFWFLIVLISIYGLATAIIESSSIALIADYARSERYGTAMGVQGTIMDIGHATGPLVSGLMLKQFGFIPTIYFSATLLVMSTVVFLWSFRSRDA
ncbi:MAG: MFS transporter [Thermincolia bacterium]